MDNTGAKHASLPSNTSHHWASVFDAMACPMICRSSGHRAVSSWCGRHAMRGPESPAFFVSASYLVEVLSRSFTAL